MYAISLDRIHSETARSMFLN